ncbi:predicted protein [Scheffersomyces stipitis CBS 6054]|uniref:DH domain-containing protein n=1 Tax=Scheffersomyces stipitis (strain ATCC 58785 / CBS 6054 / NBRC 10063 / NRRL Y-11545) TaxID=322104 RepID=A3LZC0_PICST|nr:predicted protein [Scheffersomyces stipitis CBS 6054]ABN68129.2 predicted protein [Scheffersomyces stipitis CBS 6054]
MEVNSQPAPPFRSVSTTSNLSINSSSTSITRVASGPLIAMNQNFNKLSSPSDHLYFQCQSLKQKLGRIHGMEPFLASAYSAAEQCAEQQALALSQQMAETSNGRNDFRSSVGSSGFSIHSDHSNSSNSFAANKDKTSNNIFTFTAGILPANISVDPATLMWKLFQQGAPLCLAFNAVVPGYQIPVVGSDDLRICKKSVYDFLFAVKSQLNFDDDMIFTISNVFSDSTEDLLKIIKVVDSVLSVKKDNPHFSFELESSPSAVGEVIISNERSKVFKEIIDTERKYVTDLELLSRYKSELVNAELIPNEQIHSLFPNLNEIIDFHRRLLNGLECNINVPYKYQRIGSIFIHAAAGPFKAYEPWTIGQMSAIDLIYKESSNLKKSSTLLDPGFELQSYIIKPIQRLCKYPLLLKELIKASPESLDPSIPPSASFNEMIVARNAMKEMANQVNEAQRRAENVEYLHQLVNRVSNWRGFNLRDQGELLHHGVVGVKDSDTEKEYVAYLFERIIFFFVETDKPDQSKDKKKILSSRKKSSASSSTANLLESITKAKSLKSSPLELKGRVYISEIYNISAPSNLGYSLVISWSGKKESGSFTLRYRTDEIRNQWETCLRNLKTTEMNSQIQRKLRDSSGSQDSSIYDVTAYSTNNASPNNTLTGSNENGSSRSSNGSSYQRHHSSSSTFSMMRQSRSRSLGGQDSSTRLSTSSGVPNYNSSNISTPITPSIEDFGNDIRIRLIYNTTEIPDWLIVSTTIQFNELYSKISGKIVTSEVVTDDILVNKLKYKDEDGDFVVMDSNDDWVLAMDMLNEMSESDSSDSIGMRRDLTIWVS